jgi:hypothetical protein
MNNFGLLMLSWLAGQEFPQEEFDKAFIDYFKTNPNGYDEVMKSVEQVPENIREGIRERFNKLYEQAKKGGQDE